LERWYWNLDIFQKWFDGLSVHLGDSLSGAVLHWKSSNNKKFKKKSYYHWFINK
jgi:hypothetical protein